MKLKRNGPFVFMDSGTIPYTRHEVTPEDEAAVLRVLRSDRLTQGPEVEAFEHELAEKVGAKYAVAVSSGTAALHLAYLACGVGPGTTVLTSPVSFVATANAALYCGATLLFGEGDSWPSGGTDVFVPVTLGGEFGAPLTDQVFGGKRPRIVVDACHGPYNLPPGVEAAVLSFHPAKHVAAGEGGAVVTNDAVILSRCRVTRDHGRHPAFIGQASELGFNYRMNEMSAALARSQLQRLDRSIQRRREIAAQYDEAFTGKVQTVPHGPDSARHLYQLLVEHRDDVRQQLAEKGVGSQVHYSPIIPLQPYYRERFGYRKGMWPNAEWHAAHTLSIPMFPTLTEREIEHVIRSVLEVA